ncbi:MAG: ABC-2 family transporter protein, partial [Myxococcota bacterium]|nr:ABC-2 family transporter protein [Myxococcota bacterium]
SLGLLVHHRGTAVGLVYQGAAFARYPLDVFPGPLQRLLLFICPFGWIAAVPATWLAGRTPVLAVAMLQPVVGLVVLAIGVGAWRMALGRYRSPGS